ncbi:MAG: hypothetical protein ABI402_05785 [Ferruginibacter sp.]
MDDHYKILQTIFDIVKDDAQPETYKCRPREIILREYQSWTVIETHLKILEKEGLVTIKQEDTVVIFITAAGIEFMKAARKFQF